MLQNKTIQIIAAPSILGLAPTGVEHLAGTLLNSGLARALKTTDPVLHVPLLNHLYSNEGDATTKCLNPQALRDFSIGLSQTVSDTIKDGRFAFTLGGDCSILLGIMSGLKSIGNYGLIFLDAHADFYLPEQSTTGQAADMDLALVTGRGPEQLTNIKEFRPYVPDVNVIHIGQRDWDETQHYGSADIKDTKVKCFDLALIREKGIEAIITDVLLHLESLTTDGFWIHFDTDVLDDAINPAVDYRLPGGLTFGETEHLLNNLLATGRMAGISVSIFNPSLDKDGTIAAGITEMLGRAFNVS